MDRDLFWRTWGIMLLGLSGVLAGVRAFTSGSDNLLRSPLSGVFLLVGGALFFTLGLYRRVPATRNE